MLTGVYVESIVNGTVFYLPTSIYYKWMVTKRIAILLRRYFKDKLGDKE